MDHANVEKNALVERYYRGLLPAEDEIAFEEHFMACPDCQQRLELHRGLERGLKAMVAEDAARVVSAGLLAWLARRKRWAQLGALGLALLIAVGVPTLWLGTANRRLRSEMAAVQISASGLATRAETAEKNAAALETKLTELTAAAARRSVGRLPVYLLRTLRGETGEAGTRVPAGEAFALAFDPGPDARFVSYRATVLDAAGQEVFDQDTLRLNELEVVLLSFPGDFFAPGEYRLEVEGALATGATTPLGGYPFRIAPVS